MVVSVPILARADVLLIGGTLPAISLARECSAKGHSVFVATPWAFLGEDLCATLDLASPKSAAFQALLGTDDFATPRAIKAAADAALIEAGIPFLFQMRPIGPMRDEAGRICGVLFGTRTGFQAIQARVVIDTTPFSTFARAAGVPFEPLTGGVRHVVAHVLGQASDGDGAYSVQVERAEIQNENRAFPLVRVEADLEFPDGSPRGIATTLNTFRTRFFHPDAVEAPEEITVDWQSAPLAPIPVSAETPVFVGVPSLAQVEAFLAALPAEPGKPASFGTFPSPAGAPDAAERAFDVVRRSGYPRFGDKPVLPLDLTAFPLLDTCDVYVAGAGTGGAPAAISAGRSGVRTICTENLSILGGLMTVGRIGRYWFGRRVGFAQEGDKAVNAVAPGNRNNRDGGFNGDWRADWFLREALASGVCVLPQTLALAAAIQPGGTADTVCGALVSCPWGTGIIRAGAVVDATGNGDIAAAAGAQPLETLSREPAVQGAGVSPIQLGISYTNNDFTFVLDSDVVDATRAFVTAHARYPEHFDTASILGTRERRRIRGDVVLHPVDFYAGRTYHDTVCVASSNFDTHGYTLSPLFMVVPPTHDPLTADVPLRALTPQGLERILVTGLAVSADRDAMPLIRMMADVQNQGFAAGRIAAEAARANLPVRGIALRPIQHELVQLGLLPERVLTDTDHVPEPDETDPNTDAARLLANPDAARPILRQRLAGQPDNLAAAQLLAFLGDDTGRTLLLRTLDAPWDEGWNYTGMGQFGRSVSPMDVSLLALQRIGGSPAALLRKLSELTMGHAFSHIRTVCLCLLDAPAPEAVPDLERLLAEPGATGHAIATPGRAIETNRPDYNDTSLRNAQLRELYTARALYACQPGHARATEILASYRNGMQGAYIPFATV